MKRTPRSFVVHVRIDEPPLPAARRRGRHDRRRRCLGTRNDDVHAVPEIRSARGSAPATSARLPVLANGTHSEVIIRTRMSHSTYHPALICISLWPIERLDRRDPAARNRGRPLSFVRSSSGSPSSPTPSTCISSCSRSNAAFKRASPSSLEVSEASFRSHEAEGRHCFGSRTSCSNSPSYVGRQADCRYPPPVWRAGRL